MHARVAHFEGGDAAVLDEELDDMRRVVGAFRGGHRLLADLPAEAMTLMETVARWVELVDRTAGLGALMGSCSHSLFCSSPMKPDSASKGISWQIQRRRAQTENCCRAGSLFLVRLAHPKHRPLGNSRERHTDLSTRGAASSKALLGRGATAD